MDLTDEFLAPEDMVKPNESYVLALKSEALLCSISVALTLPMLAHLASD